jgi:hypothetical protein
MKEVWKEVAGYEGHYKVSNLGNVFSIKRNIILKPRLKALGYYDYCLSLKSKYKHIRIHRLVATHFIPNPDNLTDVHHKDEDKSNNKVTNLEWIDGGKHNKLHKASLTDADVLKVRQLRKSRGWGPLKISRKLGISKGIVANIIYEVCYKDIW